MKVLISGSSGMVGRRLRADLEGDGHEVVRLVRPRTVSVDGEKTLSWDPARGVIDDAALAELGRFSVVHLAGDNIAEGRWTAAKKARIRESRVQATLTLSTALARLEVRPEAFVSASATGYYGDRGDQVLTEVSAPGSGFLPAVCKDWEDASNVLGDAGCRRAVLRFGVVLSVEGGALKKMLLPFKMGLGGRIGPGLQYMSWLSLDDACRIIRFALEDDRVCGSINAVAPGVVTNAEFTKALGCAVSRPTIIPMPAIMARIAFGQMADDLLLASARVAPRVLEELGYEFRHRELDVALEEILAR